jgi:hypothetical protein
MLVVVLLTRRLKLGQASSLSALWHHQRTTWHGYKRRMKKTDMLLHRIIYTLDGQNN